MLIQSSSCNSIEPKFRHQYATNKSNGLQTDSPIEARVDQSHGRLDSPYGENNACNGGKTLVPPEHSQELATPAKTGAKHLHLRLHLQSGAASAYTCRTFMPRLATARAISVPKNPPPTTATSRHLRHANHHMRPFASVFTDTRHENSPPYTRFFCPNASAASMASPPSSDQACTLPSSFTFPAKLHALHVPCSKYERAELAPRRPSTCAHIDTSRRRLQEHEQSWHDGKSKASSHPDTSTSHQDHKRTHQRIKGTFPDPPLRHNDRAKCAHAVPYSASYNDPP